MLTLEQIAVLVGSDSPLLSRFSASVRKAIAEIGDEADTVPNHALRLAFAKLVFKERKYQFYATLIMDYAIVQPTALWDKGGQITDDEIDAIVSAYLVKVARLAA